MKKHGKKIIAILFTAVCLIGVLPFSCMAATETVYVPPIAALTPDMRYSASTNGYITANGLAALTIPLKIDKDIDYEIDLGQLVSVQARLFYINADYSLNAVVDIGTSVSTSIQVIDPLEQYRATSTYVVVNLNYPDLWNEELTIYNQSVTVLNGSYTLASPERYEQIEIPDDPEPEPDSDVVGNALTFWQQLLTTNIEPLSQMYNELTNPIALIFGIPLCIAIISLIFHVIGGKRR